MVKREKGGLYCLDSFSPLSLFPAAAEAKGEFLVNRPS